ncbi:hypothetical protein PR001_g1464 [Phytophthora rubi]|uniref:Uncharacterized protein n=1 Tax=Phytophthora rubi TaxID=129364 RepID=A0A6A3P725_9STRA|nr:hypothetical protein PR002_g1573 [Phytophthora rubi]KAE9051425.1 hypothetical protein PR001_g1464 [Phytophthora rubi]
MLAAAAFASAAALLAATIPSADAHGYMLIPESQFKGSANSAWVVQIDPVWTSDKWDGNNPQSVDTFKSLKSANNFKDLKTLMDDTSVYGADCGFTDPNGTPQPIPTDGKATFSRAWCTMARVRSGWTTRSKGGCKEMRFYWLAFQGLNKKTVWQSYKDCIPLKGSGGGGSSTSQTQSSSTSDVSQTMSSGDSNSPSSGDSNSLSSGDSNSPSSGGSSSPSSGDSNTPSSGESTTPAPESNDYSSTQGSSSGTPEVTPAPSSMCNGRKRRY